MFMQFVGTTAFIIAVHFLALFYLWCTKCGHTPGLKIRCILHYRGIMALSKLRSINLNGSAIYFYNTFV